MSWRVLKKPIQARRSASPGRRTLAALALGLFTLATALAQDGLAPVTIIDFSIPEPLTQTPGDPAAGERTVRDSRIASCLICHALPIADEPDPGNIGPSLAGVGSRYSAAELRLRLVNPKAIDPDTIMPAYYWLDGLHRVDLPYQGRTIYSAQQIEDVIAYLLTLTDDTEGSAP